MAKSKNENINVAIFQALKISEISKVPTLIMSNPGIGKSTSVAMFAKVRGYHLQLLRGNSTTESEVLGYDIAETEKDSKTTKHMRPAWYTKILEKDKEGIPTLLFLDEITTANEWVQGALLHLVFERMVGDEELPASTLIVSAGNYAQNLSNSMNMLPPLMNRFMLFNIVPEVSDLDIFLSKYRGAIASPDGLIPDKLDELIATMKLLDDQEDKTMTTGIKNKVGEHIERCILEVTKMLWNRERLIDLSEKDLKDIYSDDDSGDKKLYGFVTFRTLNYLRDVTIAMFQCFGKPGLISDNYRNMVDGLCGMGVARDSKGNIKKSMIGKNYFDAMRTTVNEIEKMKNSSLPVYERFFFDTLNKVKERGGKKKILEKAEMQAIINKMEEMSNDPGVMNIERPIDIEVIKDICNSIKDSGAKLADMNIKSGSDLLGSIDTAAFAGKIDYWNVMIDLYNSFNTLASSEKANYSSDVKSMVTGIKEDLRRFAYCIKAVRKVICNDNAAMENLIPIMKTIDSAI